jgi:hypothetical protein
MAARKDDADAALNALRFRIQRRQVKVARKCTTVIAHLRNAIWNKAKTSFERSGQFGHFDAVDACKYLVRHVDWDKNPYPDRVFSKEDCLVKPKPEETNIARLFRPRYRSS